MIQIIPSILIHNGKVVRLKQSDYSQVTVYDKSPVDLAWEYEDHGIEVVHLVDLDGAKRGAPINYHVLEAIAGHTKLKVDFTGGITTDGDISKAYEYGASYITAATIAAYQPDLFASWIISYGREKMTLGADSLDGKIAIKGWIKKTQIDLFEHIGYFYNRGLKYVKTTDIARNGLLEGPSFDLYKKIIDKFPGIQVLACGGVRNCDDIEELNKIGVFAVIIGKAFYEGNITLDEVSKFCMSKE
ncbi:MAG: 1-(5-phosphoribosyl)-5-[(5-phosphoribosylamino)methylideneamino] imidazole-4-carboxamide isomerase [Bacteroidetes bacterium]|nr:1-(5-phosphoribosyl)-5-[(5-phosphoribosylamino)methylideneamino] imidazole-4-carboxamide isomerase [Bacteroidota bacterium]